MIIYCLDCCSKPRPGKYFWGLIRLEKVLGFQKIIEKTKQTIFVSNVAYSKMLAGVCHIFKYRPQAVIYWLLL